MKGIEFRIQATDRTNRAISRVFAAPSKRAAREKATSIARAQGWKIVSLDQKRTYSYRVKRGGNFYDGVQSAYSRDEVLAALRNLQFEVKSVRRHHEFQFQAPSIDLVTFIGTSARLLEQKLPFTDILQIMMTNVQNKSLKNALRSIIKDLKDGTDSQEAFMRQSKVFGHDTALMLGIASKSGDMKSIFQSVAHFVERQAEFKKGLASSLILPGVTSLSLIGAIGFYVLYLLPQTVEMLGPMADSLPPLTTNTLAFADFIKDNWLPITAFMFGTTFWFYWFISTSQGRILFDRSIIRVPYVGKILQNTSVELFCRVLGIMYTGGENIDAILRAAEASHNRFLERQIKTISIPSMLKYGKELSSALEATTFFPEMAITRFKTAAETGDVKATAVQLADYYEMENHYSMKNLISVIEVSISLMIMGAMVFLTVLSSETASIKIN